MQQISKQPAFDLGQIVATPGALAAHKKAGQQPVDFLMRHVNREWGDIPDEDRRALSTTFDVWATTIIAVWPSSTPGKRKRA